MMGYLHRVPAILYGLAVTFFAWSVINSFWELNQTHAYAAIGDQMVALAKSKSLFQASLDSVYLAANGALIHVLIKIYERMKAE